MPDSYAETNSGLLFVFSGWYTPLRWDGLTTTMETVGVIAPTTAPTVTGSGSGAIVGTYTAYIRFVDRYGNYSNLSPISSSYTTNGSTGTITGATNATPVVITSASHGLSTGDTVKITGVGGNTSANTTDTITVVDSDSFELDNTSGTATYTGDGTWVAGVETITYTGLAVPTESKVTRRQILRNTDGQATTYYVDIDTTDISSTSLSSTNVDSTLSAQEAQAILDSDGAVLANRNDVPPNYKPFVARMLDRMFAAGSRDYSKGMVQVTVGSITVTGIGTNWTEALEGRYLWVTGATASYLIDSVDTVNQTLTLDEAYQDVTNKFGDYAIRASDAERRLVWYSEAGKPESWSALNAIAIPESNDEVTGLMPKGSWLYILENRHIWKLTFQNNPQDGGDGAVFEASRRGCVNNNCWVLVNDQAYMLDEQGLHVFGLEDGGISDVVQNLFRPGDEAPYRINWRAREWFHAVHYQPQTTIRWFVAMSGNFVPRHALCFNYSLKRFWVEEYHTRIGSSVAGRIKGVPYNFLASKKVYAAWEGHLDEVDRNLGTVRGTATAATLFTLSDSLASFPASTIVGAPLVIVDGKGKGQRRKIVEVSGTQLRVDRPWLVLPDTTSVYQIGGISWHYTSSHFRLSEAETLANRNLEFLFKKTTKPQTFDIRVYENFSSTARIMGRSISSSAGDGVKATDGKTDLVVDMTKASGFVQTRLPGHRETFSEGVRFAQIEFGGVTQDETIINQMTYYGVGNPTVIGGGR